MSCVILIKMYYTLLHTVMLKMLFQCKAVRDMLAEY